MPNQNSSNLPKVTVVVTSHNNESTIGRCLRSIATQRYPNIELIVVDNSSSDKTKEISKSYTDNVFDCGPERSAQRNFGLDKASGTYLLWIDSDMILDNNVVSSCVDYSESQIEPVSIIIDEIVLGKRFYQGVRRLENELLRGSAVEAARFFKKEDFVKTNGFDEDITGGEDWDITNQISEFTKVVNLPTEENNTNDLKSNPDQQPLDSALLTYVSMSGIKPKVSPVIYHDDQITFADKLKKRSYYADGYKKYKQKWANSETLKLQLSPISRFKDMFTHKGNIKKMLFHPIKFLALVSSKAFEFVLAFGSKG